MGDRLCQLVEQRPSLGQWSAADILACELKQIERHKNDWARLQNLGSQLFAADARLQSGEWKRTLVGVPEHFAVKDGPVGKNAGQNVQLGNMQTVPGLFSRKGARPWAFLLEKSGVGIFSRIARTRSPMMRPIGQAVVKRKSPVLASFRICSGPSQRVCLSARWRTNEVM